MILQINVFIMKVFDVLNHIMKVFDVLNHT
jgi:hypothetical protein